MNVNEDSRFITQRSTKGPPAHSPNLSRRQEKIITIFQPPTYYTTSDWSYLAFLFLT